MDVFFRTEQLTVGYNGRPLIRDIDIRLGRGQILTLIGPNGAGKSTILKSVARQLRYLGGAVYIDRRSLDELSGPQLARELSVMLTGRPRTERMTCADVVATGRAPHTGLLGILGEEDKWAVRRAMERVHAWPLRERDFGAISDGQRQRVLLARALCQQPRVMVLDEPTSHLDVRHSLELLSILRRLAEEQGITVILSLHELDMAQRVSDLVLCVDGERVTHCGPPREIFTRERIEALYGLAGGSYNPLFGSFELPRTAGAPRVFVIAGGGTGAAEFRALQKRGIPFAAGILHEHDVDCVLARDLAAEVFAERAFEPIGEEVYARAVQALERCEAVVCCLREYGAMNARNRQLAERARAIGKRVVSCADALA